MNVDQIGAMPHRTGEFGGFHVNDSSYGDDDLAASVPNPYRLFFIFNELIEAYRSPPRAFRLAYMIDQPPNLTDPTGSLIGAAEAIVGAYACAILANRAELRASHESNDVMLAFRALKMAYNVDVAPILAWIEADGAADPITMFR